MDVGVFLGRSHILETRNTPHVEHTISTAPTVDGIQLIHLVTKSCAVFYCNEMKNALSPSV